MDNGAYMTINETMTTMDIKYQVVNPGNTMSNNTDKSIKKFKNHFIEELCSVDADSHLQIWDRMLQQ